MKLYLKDGTWRVAFEGEGATHHELDTDTSDKSEAERIVAEAKIGELEHAARVMRLGPEAITRIVSGSRVSIAQALKEWEKWMRDTGHLSATTVANNLRVVGAWLRDSKLEDFTPASIQAGHVNRWVNRESKHKQGTRRLWLSVLRSFFHFMHAKGWLVGDPSQLVRLNMNALDHTQKEVEHADPFTEAEVRLLLGSTQGFWHSAILISATTGLRLGDICQLEWACLDGHLLHVHTDKRNVRVTVEVTKELQDHLAAMKREHPVHLFPKERELALDPARRHTFSQQFSRVCRTLKLEGQRRFHGLRGTFARNRVATVGLEQTAKELGHASTKTTTKHYL